MMRGLPCYVYDLGALADHAARIRTDLDGAAEIFYAAKANPDPRLLETLAPLVDGFEVSSGGELAHLRSTVPGARLAFGGPGKTDEELAMLGGVERVHVESPHELARLKQVTRDRPTDVLLRMNPPIEIGNAALRMNGPFGMDTDDLARCLDLLADAPWIRLRGIHAHLASGLDAAELLEVAGQILDRARRLIDPPMEVNLGGGMAVDYGAPDSRFDWPAYGAGLAALKRAGETLRIEPGRSMTAYCGWYVTEVLDVKRTNGDWYAILRGGTQHLRTPVTKGHDQPCQVLTGASMPWRGGFVPWQGAPADGPWVAAEPVTLVGRLCTPKDVFARHVRLDRIVVGDVVAFALAGAYAWNISHHDFLMHPKPLFHYV
jgi:diaminopimelate decarboxylase